MLTKPIVVLGSINMDLVCRVARRPGAGETVLGEDLLTVPGGKGANQAVAAARLGGRVAMIGRVGDDAFGGRMRAGLAAEGIDVARVRVTEGTASGCAMILVDAAGENSIVVSPGANARLTPADVEGARGLIEGAGALVVQLEVPLEAVLVAAEIARAAGVSVVLDPAPVPAGGLPPALWNADLLTPNEHEAALLMGGVADPRDHSRLVDGLLARGPACVVVKCGAAGAAWAARDGRSGVVGGHRVTVVDTTAAGDAFTAGLAVGLCDGMDLTGAIRLANAAGAMACVRVGAQPALPDRRAVEGLLGGAL